MTIAPVVQTVQVKAPPPRAFALFTGRMADWWPKGKTLGKSPHQDIVIEPWPGGRWFERDGAGMETDWGRVKQWEPPSRVVLSWEIDCEWGHNPEIQTEVEIGFAPVAGGGTLVRLEHRNLERFGLNAAELAERVRNGWPGMVAEYARFVELRAAEAELAASSG